MHKGKLFPDTFVDAVVPAVGLVAMMAAMATMVVGLAFLDRHATAVSCATSGLAVSAYAWCAVRCRVRRASDHLVRAAFSLGAGLCIYVGLAWLLWSCQVPVGLRFVDEGSPAAARWISLALFIYTGVCFSVLRGAGGRIEAGDSQVSSWFVESRVRC